MKPVKCGFTLVELLIVVAIISLLAGLLLPALEDAVAQARKASCAVKQRQIHQTSMLYAGDNNDWGLCGMNMGTAIGINPSFVYYSPYSTAPNYNAWIFEYFPANEIFLCPDCDSKISSLRRDEYPANSNRYVQDTTYRLLFGTGNALSTGYHHGWRDTTALSDTSFPDMVFQCANIRYLGRADGYGPYGNDVLSASKQASVMDIQTTAKCNFPAPYQWNTAATPYWSNHFEQYGENVTYMDGHCEWKLEEDLTYYFYNLGSAWF